jgi:hypothetical protein
MANIQGNNRPDLEIELLKKEVHIMSTLMSKLDVTIEKLTSVANSLDRVIAVHDSKLEHQEKVDTDLYSLIENRRTESRHNYELLHKRIGDLRDDLERDIEKSNDNLIAVIKEMQAKDVEHHKDTAERLANLESWRWYIIGVSSLAGFLLSFMF